MFDGPDGYFLTAAHHRLRERVREFAEDRIAAHVPEMERAQRVEHELARSIARQGWIGATVELRYGGLGQGHLARR